jgi:predicted RNA binding protein YcfA (HicA-like mRNA interferase family)
VTPLSGRELARLVESSGWNLLRVNGSHHIYSPATARELAAPPG